MKTDDVIMHQQIMHTWASFALEHDLDFYNEKHMESMVKWTEEAIEALKEYGTQVQYRDDHIAEYEKEIKRLNKLLKEQEAVEPITEHIYKSTIPIIHEYRDTDLTVKQCGNCFAQLFLENQKYCAECGSRIRWDDVT